MAFNMRKLWNDLSTADAAPPTSKSPTPPSQSADAPGGGLELPPDWQDSPNTNAPPDITPPKPTAPVLESITLIPNKNSIAVGESVQVSVMGKYSDGSSRPVTGECMWSGGPADILLVSGNGSGTGVRTGSAKIMAVHMKYTNVSNSTSVIVTGAPSKPPEPVLEQIILDPGGYDVMCGPPVQFRATGKFPGWPDEDLTNVVVWTSDKPAVAAIAGNGIIQTKSAGTAIITAKHGNRKATATVTVRGGAEPKPQARTLMVVPPSAYIAIGEPVIFTARRLLPDGTAGEIVKDVSWSQVPPDIVTFNPAQHLVNIAGKSAGTVRIIASGPNGNGEAIVTVKPEKLGAKDPSTIGDMNGQTGGAPTTSVTTPPKGEQVEIIPPGPVLPTPRPTVPGPTPLPAPPPVAPPSGKSKDVILGLQKALKKVGYDPGPIDGIMGPKTSTALKQFQKDNGLAADGVAGPATQAAMAKALKAAVAGGGGGDPAAQTGTLKIEPADPKMPCGGRQPFEAWLVTGSKKVNVTKHATWSSDNEVVAISDEKSTKGLATAGDSPGTATIKAVLDAPQVTVSGETTVTVEGPGGPQTGTGSMEVHVHDEAGKPVQGATVGLATGPTKKPNADTNAGGIVRFEGLADGKYHVNAAKRNIVWQPAYPAVAAGDTVTVFLRKLAKPGPETPSIEIYPIRPRVNCGAWCNFQASIKGTNTVVKATWQSSDSNVMRINSQTGEAVAGTAEGKATITATALVEGVPQRASTDAVVFDKDL
ncbi:MAG: Ig-like domain-containing protein [Gemmataceae bacterium]|nr:Ig-like domain-containing protein [Gemmataceae bacterium]